MGFYHHFAVAAIAATVGFAPVQAANFLAESGFGTPPSFGTCKTANVTAPFSTGSIIATPDWTGGCIGWFGVDVDTTAMTITLTGLQYGNYSYGYLSITGLSGITGVTTLQSDPLFDPTFYGGGVATAVPVPLVTFTGSSIYIGFDATGLGDGQFNYSNDIGGQAIFSYTTGAVPEPASWALMIAGFGMVGFALRRKATLATA